MTPSYVIVIPARYASTRLPGKPLAVIGDKPLIQHVHERAGLTAATRTVIATDDDRIAETARGFGAEVIMTATDHQSGTDRIHEAVTQLGLHADTIIVNLQGDEYGIDPGSIDLVAEALSRHPRADMATLCERIASEEACTDPNIVKVVLDAEGFALYFSRSVIPWHGRTGPDSAIPVYRHLGLYAYRAGFIGVYANLPRPALEMAESLEQLRALYHGYRIHVLETAVRQGQEINTPGDLEKARKAWEVARADGQAASGPDR